jgi:hypothetical protein
MALLPAGEPSDGSSQTVRGTAQDSGGGLFGRVASRVAGRVSETGTRVATQRLSDALGGSTGAASALLKGDIKGAVKSFIEGDQTGLAKGYPSRGPKGATFGRASGKVGGPAFVPSANLDVMQWGGLNPNLIASIYPSDSDGILFDDAKAAEMGIDNSPVYAPITDANFEVSLNWQSPFENTGPESKAPALMSMIQTGQLATVANALQNVLPGGGGDGFIGRSLESIKQGAKELEGRTGITKLNSRQVFSGMPPIKLTMTVHFRAMIDPVREVQEPFERLLKWALPQQLAKDGVLVELFGAAANGGDFIKALFPSKSPLLIGFTYANERYAPMVIETVGKPLDVQRDGRGVPIRLAVPITLATLTALDKNDVVNIFTRA